MSNDSTEKSKDQNVQPRPVEPSAEAINQNVPVNGEKRPLGPIAQGAELAELSTGATGTEGPGQRKILLTRYECLPWIKDDIISAKSAYDQLVVEDRRPEIGDQFFQKYGPGNTLDTIDRPSERFRKYEGLLDILRVVDKEKYKKIHKGTPFYFLSWTAFLMRDYEKAVFYMDAAVSEDQKNCPDWETLPAGDFLTLNDKKGRPAQKITEKLRKLIEEQFTRFNQISNKEQLTPEKFVGKFVKPVMENTGGRSILTAFYGFILEYVDRFAMLSLRSEIGGSIEPFLVHLFKGGLVFESLLKYVNNGYERLSLEKIFGDEGIQSRYGIKIKKKEAYSIGLRRTISFAKNGVDIKTAFIATARIRNACGHNLAGQDAFKKPEDYKYLYNQIINALLYIIAEELSLVNLKPSRFPTRRRLKRAFSRLFKVSDRPGPAARITR